MSSNRKAFLKCLIGILIIGLIGLGGFGIYKVFIENPDYQWCGIYRATTNTYPDSSRYITDSIMVQISEENEEYQISVLGKKVIGPQNGEGGTTVQTYISGEEEVELVAGNQMRFTIDMFPDDETLGLYHIELVKVSDDEMGFRYASSQEELKSAEYVILARSEN